MRAARFSLALLGLMAIAYGLQGALSPGMQPVRHFLFLAGLVVAHDLVLMPLMLGIGWLIVRLVPVTARAVVQGGLIIAAAVTLVAVPFVLGLGRPADNPSALPGNYLRGLLIIYAVLAVSGVVIVLIRRRRKVQA